MKNFIALAVALLVCLPSIAAAESKEEKALRVFELVVTPEFIGDMGTRAGRMLTDQMNASLARKGKALSLGQQSEFIARFSSMFEDLMADFTPQVSQIYAEEMTERELDLLIEVDDDPEMAALLSKMPIVMERMMPIIQKEIPARTEDLVKQLVADGVLSDL